MNMTEDESDAPGPGQARTPAPFGGWPLVGGLVAVLLILGLNAISQSRTTAEELRRVFSDAYSTDMAFERAIGYGGLIHNFKNAVLRTDEPHYLAAARADVERALALVGDLEVTGDSMGLAAHWRECRRMVEAYSARLDQLEVLAREGSRPAELDELLRFDDSAALLERELSRDVLHRAILARMNEIDDTSLSTVSLVALGIVAALAIAAASSLAKSYVKAHDSLVRSHENTTRANVALQQFAGIAAHDLSKPIRHVQFFCELIGDDPGNPEHTMGLVAQIEAATANMNEMTRALLEFTREGFQVLHPKATDMTKLVSGVVDSMAPDIDTARATVTVGQLHDCAVDADLMRRVFTNLISNGLKYARPGVLPTVAIASTADEQWIEYSVSDNGIGIESQFAEQIFRPMERLHGPQSEFKGFGLGLSLVKSIMEGHRGSIMLDTEFVGGSRFVLRLPVSTEIRVT